MNSLIRRAESRKYKPSSKATPPNSILYSPLKWLALVPLRARKRFRCDRFVQDAIHEQTQIDPSRTACLSIYRFRSPWRPCEMNLQLEISTAYRRPRSWLLRDRLALEELKLIGNDIYSRFYIRRRLLPHRSQRLEIFRLDDSRQAGHRNACASLLAMLKRPRLGGMPWRPPLAPKYYWTPE